MRGLPVAPIFFPILAFFLWLYLFFSFLPVLHSELEFPQQVLRASLFVSNLILVLTWFLGGQVLFAIFAALTALLCVYLVLALGEPGLWIQAAAVAGIYAWLAYLSRQIESERLIHLVNRERIQTKLNLSYKELEEKEHLLAALERKLNRLKNLREFSDRLKDTISLKNMSQAILGELTEMMPHADQTLIYIIDEKSYELGLVAHAAKDPASEAKHKKGNEYDEWVIRRSQPLLIEDAKTDFRFSVEREAGSPFRSVCLVPLVSERKTFGVLHLNAREPGAFHTDDLRFLDIVADLSAVSLRNVLLYEKTKELAIIDSLTECYLFRYVQDRLSEEIHRALRNQTPFAVIMADIDHFKKYNDEFGHTAGDTVLKVIADILRSSVGPSDIVGRYGGEEFILVLPQKNLQEAAALAEAIRKKVESRPFDLRRESRNITLSLGVSAFPQSGTTKEELIWAADKNLYAAKKAGRNRVSANSEPKGEAGKGKGKK